VMIYSHYSEYMARSMSANRPLPDPGEYEWLQGYLSSNEQPFVELACGYGRLLLPIMEHGYSIVGTDASPEMLAHCRTLAQAKGLQPRLHRQLMQELSLAETFGFIFIADCTFVLIIEEQGVHDLFTRVWNHLKPGGTFLFDFFTIKPDRKATKGEVTMGWKKADDGSIFVGKKISSYDPVSHITWRLQVHDCYVNGAFAGSQAYEDHNRDYDPLWVCQALADDGFVDIQLGGHHSDAPPGLDAGEVSIRCKRPR
jgi:SAM-dependent methyltransferase